MNFGLMPLTSQTIVINTAAAAAAVPGIKRGLLYRVVADVDIHLEISNGNAANHAGLYIPAKVEHYFMFGSSDSQGKDPVVSVYGPAGYAHFTPVVKVT
jgi:hypothetical protein